MSYLAMSRNERMGVFSLLASALLFSFTTVLIKLSSAEYSSFVISSMRFGIGIVLGLSLLRATRKKISVRNKKDWFLRGFYGAISMTLGYSAISLTSSGRATLLGNTYPVFVAIFAALFFKERLHASALPSLALCTLGSAIVLNDGAGYPTAGDMLALLSAVFSGIAVNHLKRASDTEDPVVLYLSPCVFGLPVSVFLSAGSFKFLPGPFALAMLSGIVVFAAQILMTWGYKRVPVSRGSRIFYLETVLAVAFGAMIGENLKPAFFFGGALILSGLALDAWIATRVPDSKISVRS